VGDTTWATGSEIATLASSLVVFYLITTRLGAEGYGYFIGGQTLIAVLAMLSSAWVGLLLLQEVVREGTPASAIFPACTTLVLSTGCLAVTLCLALGSVLLPGLALGTLALFAVAELLGASLLNLAASVRQANADFAGFAKLRTGLTALRVSAVVIIILLGRISLLSIAVAYCTVSVLAGLIALGDVIRRFDLPRRPGRPTWSTTKKGLSYAGALVAFSVQEDADKILLVRLADPVTAGVYAVAYRAVQLALVPIRALTSSSHRAFLQHDPFRRGEHRTRALRYTALATSYGAVAVVLLLVLSPAVPRILGEEYRAATPMILFLAPLVLFRALSLFAFNGLMGLGRSGARLVIIGCSAILNLLLNAALIQKLGWQGAATATLLVEGAFLTATWLALVWYQRAHDNSVHGTKQSGMTKPAAQPGDERYEESPR
jgi:O-antigen/teichoic acid export membrane protein